ncbi:MAG: arsenate reductase ArsC [Dehalococcoidia bacterium]|jgi:arsenate reductase|nr:arsenate reductase ArsC [Dehalococcoidia bacterium]
MTEKIRILFLCTGNSCRSQMAEGWTRHLKGGLIEPYSAGVQVKPVDPLAVTVMAEAGVDISQQRSKHVSEVISLDLDYVVTVCSHARETCPYFPGGGRNVHMEFDDPPWLTRGTKDETEKLQVYRRVRDEIRRFVESLPQVLNAQVN